MIWRVKRDIQVRVDLIWFYRQSVVIMLHAYRWPPPVRLHFGHSSTQKQRILKRHIGSYPSQVHISIYVHIWISFGYHWIWQPIHSIFQFWIWIFVRRGITWDHLTLRTLREHVVCCSRSWGMDFTCKRIRTGTGSRIYMYIHTCTYIHVYLSIYLSIHLSIYLSLSLSLYIYIYTDLCLCVRMHVYITYSHTQYMWIMSYT